MTVCGNFSATDSRGAAGNFDHVARSRTHALQIGRGQARNGAADSSTRASATRSLRLAAREDGGSFPSWHRPLFICQFSQF